ncbi:MAG: hypothetical protein KGZ91_21205 [Afipia sp.]|jgi:uncharacterized cupredoxin-like copper-binding protein|nr:hypothetical protein [Afipia sp.]
MVKMVKWLVCIATLLATDVAIGGPRKKVQDIFLSIDAGEPGRLTAKTVAVTVKLSGHGSEFSFLPRELRFVRRESVKFIIDNDTDETHEFVLGSHLENLAHAQTMKLIKDLDHHYQSGRVIAPRSTASFVWVFSKVGKFEFACLIPDHQQVSEIKHGTIVVD